MTIEEKAKAYDEALERARKELQACGSADCDAARQIFRFFPELQESEDELTWLTKYIEEEAYSLSIDIRDNEDRIKLKKLQRSLAWLEKQGEQKHETPIPRFNIGDWVIVHNKDAYQVILREQYDKLAPAVIREKQEEAHCILVPVDCDEMDGIRQEAVVYTLPPMPKMPDIKVIQPAWYDLPHVKGGRHHEPPRDLKKKKKAKRRQQKQARRKNRYY